MYKKVALPITVPEGKYCCKLKEPPYIVCGHVVCKHFSIGEGGYEHCAMNLYKKGEPKKDSVGCLKPDVCLNLSDA